MGEDKVKKEISKDSPGGQISINLIKSHLVAILGGDLPCVHGRVDSQLAEEGERVRDVDLGYVPGDR